MSFAALLTETATVVRYAAGVDQYGDLERGAESRTDYPARLEQLATAEVVRDRDTVTADWRVILPAGADISPYDRLEARTHVFEVAGLADVQHSPRGPHHTVALVKFVA